ncbi:MAG: hypothetical protein AB1349_09465 [Elusimicrobiota bacterium]
MAYANTLKIFEVLRQKFDEPEAKVIASAVETALETNNAALLNEVATKKDLLQETSAIRMEMREMKSELIKWMFIFWIGQFTSITTVLFLFFKR